ncbi:MAG: S8 family serine peptidase [Cyanobacteria bacterium NC_groundwater_1444_Ag_S-0.65um_54_12]|nr:S8 family serine peptidase [Cyanobacteria bacterium NC_groundwater_1444_Ag_S-0.65um_54_12]
MERKQLGISLLAALLVSWQAIGCSAVNPAVKVPTAPAHTAWLARQIIALYRPGSVPKPVLIAGKKLAEVQAFSLAGEVRVYEVPPELDFRMVNARLQAIKDIVHVVPNRPKLGSFWPNDPLFEQQWPFSRGNLNVTSFWDRRVDTSKVMVAVLDTGIDASHPELAGRVSLGANTLDVTQDSRDDVGHGTHVAGIIGAAGNNGIGVAGVAWNVRLLAVKVLGKNGGNDAAALSGISYAILAGAKVINLSFNSNDTTVNPAYQSAVDFARSRGAVVVAAAGNNGGALTQPATTPGLLAVAALRSDGSLASYSNYRGEAIGIAAPGDNIISTIPGGSYQLDSGTSMAAPFVSAAAAILLAEHPDWSVEQVINAIRFAAPPLPGLQSSSLGWGRLDLGRLP